MNGTFLAESVVCQTLNITSVPIQSLSEVLLCFLQHACRHRAASLWLLTTAPWKNHPLLSPLCCALKTAVNFKFSGSLTTVLLCFWSNYPAGMVLQLKVLVLAASWLPITAPWMEHFLLSLLCY